MIYSGREHLEEDMVAVIAKAENYLGTLAPTQQSEEGVKNLQQKMEEAKNLLATSPPDIRQGEAAADAGRGERLDDIMP